MISFSRLNTLWSKKIGIDLGSSRVRIWSETGGIVVDEPSAIAIEQETGRVVGLGEQALALSGRSGSQVRVQLPIQNGVVHDPDAAYLLLKLLFARALGSSLLMSPIIMVSMPVGATLAAKETTTQLLYSLGAQEVYIVAQPLAAAIGAGVPIADASGCFIMHLGEGVVQAAVISLGSIVAQQTSLQAGDYLAKRIAYYVQHTAGLSIARRDARLCVHKLASVDEQQQRTVLLAGKDSKTHRPKELELSATALLPETRKFADGTVQLLKQLLWGVQPELSVDVIDKGLLLSGGLAQLDGLSEYYSAELGVASSVVDDPDKAVIAGIATALEHLDLFKQSLGYQ